jgi:hypothetical protein
MLLFFRLILINFFYVLACVGTGVLIDRRSKSITIFFALGIGGLALIWQFLGLIGQFNIGFVVGLCCPLALIGSCRLYCSKNGIYCHFKSFLEAIKSCGLFWIGYTLLFTTFLFLTALRTIIEPPSGDANALYFMVPKVMAYSGQLTPKNLLGYYDFSSIGMVGEMHYGALMVLHTPFAAKLFTWVVSLFTGLIVCKIGHFIGLQTRGLIIVLVMLFSSSAFLVSIWNGKVDVFPVLLGLSCFYCMLKWQSELKDSYAPFIIGLLLGFSTVAKFSYIPVMFIGIVSLFFWNLLLVPKMRNLRFITSNILIFSAGVVLAWLPHLIKNAHFFGEPFAPFYFFGIQGQKWIEQTWYTVEATKYILWTYPIAIVFGQYPMQAGNLSPYVFAFLPLAFWLRRPSSWQKSLLVQVSTVGALCLITWMIIRPAVLSPRYIFATLILLIFFPAKCCENYLASGAPKYIKGLICLALCVGPLIYWGDHNHLAMAERLVAIENNFTDYNCKNSDLAYCFIFDQINDIAAPGARILLGGYYSYGLRGDLLVCASNSGYPDGGDLGFDRLVGAEAKLEYIIERGFEYIVIQKATHQRLIADLNLGEPPSFMKFNKIHEDEGTLVIKIQGVDNLKLAKYRCKEISKNYWEVQKL